jgi:hypothetical protein
MEACLRPLHLILLINILLWGSAGAGADTGFKVHTKHQARKLAKQAQEAISNNDKLKALYQQYSSVFGDQGGMAKASWVHFSPAIY